LNPTPSCANIIRKIDVGTLPIAFTETSYQTAPLADYDPALRTRALDPFRRVDRRQDPRLRRLSRTCPA
jgi:hypothetical protein